MKKVADLRRQLETAERELALERGKATRLSGLVTRLQQFGLTPTGQIPVTSFSDSVLDTFSHGLEADLVILLTPEPGTGELTPVVGRGLAPDVLERLRVRPGEGILGKAVQTLQPTVSRTASPADSILASPYLLLPLRSKNRCSGLLLVANPRGGPFSPEAVELATLLARQTGLLLESHSQHAEVGTQRAQSVEALLAAMEAKDAYTHQHSHRTSALVRTFAKELQLPDLLVNEIECGALLHDIGKIGIEDAILMKPGKLTPAEYDVMKTHPAIGHRLLQPLTHLRKVAAIVLYHQEWYNGSGYPEGLAGEEIPLGARIVQIVDAWDAMTSNRTYRPAMSPEAAKAELRRQEGTQFDPKLVEAFLRVLGRS